MFNSKPIADFDLPKRSKLHNWWIETRMYDWYHDFTWAFFRRPIRDIKKMYGWYMNVFRNDFDFDGHSLFAIIEYKLKRIQKALLKGHAIQDPKDMRALITAIKLAGRLKNNNYDDPFWNRHDRKWGEMKTWFTPVPGSTNSEWHSSRPNADTPETKEQERSEILALMYAADAQRKREEKWLYGILHKYLRTWWD